MQFINTVKCNVYPFSKCLLGSYYVQNSGHKLEAISGRCLLLEHPFPSCWKPALPETPSSLFRNCSWDRGSDRIYISQLYPPLKTFKPALLGLKFLLQIHAPLSGFCKSPQNSCIAALAFTYYHFFLLLGACISFVLDLPGWSETCCCSQAWFLARQHLLGVEAW